MYTRYVNTYAHTYIPLLYRYTHLHMYPYAYTYAYTYTEIRSHRVDKRHPMRTAFIDGYIPKRVHLSVIERQWKKQRQREKKSARKRDSKKKRQQEKETG